MRLVAPVERWCRVRRSRPADGVPRTPPGGRPDSHAPAPSPSRSAVAIGTRQCRLRPRHFTVLSLPTRRSSWIHRISRQAPSRIGHKCPCLLLRDDREPPLLSGMKISRSQWLAASTVVIPSLGQLLRQAILQRPEHRFRATAGLRRVSRDVLDAECFGAQPNCVSTVFDTRAPAAGVSKMVASVGVERAERPCSPQPRAPRAGSMPCLPRPTEKTQ